MITAFRQKTTVSSDGQIEINIPKLTPGAQAEVIILIETAKQTKETRAKSMTAAGLLSSGLAGMWAERKDLGNSQEFARRLRQTAERRNRA
jgi:hypothetical protein